MTAAADLLLGRCCFPPPGRPIACAVSGGADSLALLTLAVRVCDSVTAVHVDHGIRSGSGAEGDVVAAAAAGLGAAFRRERVKVPAGPNLEARARRARYEVLPDGCLTGHTADDQAETVLLHLLRGAGLDGLAGFDPATRPLHRLRRAETHQLCADLGLVPVQDPSNDDPRFRRNRVRHELMPLLDAIAERDVAPVLAAQATHLRADVALLETLAAALDPTDARALVAAPAPLARRAVRAWLRAGAERHPPDSAAVERVLAVARGEAVACELPGGRRVQRTQQRLRLVPSGDPGGAVDAPPVTLPS